MSVVKKCFLVFAVVISAANVWGQAARSPFTGFGIGEPYGNALIQNQGVGGMGVSQPQVWYLNNQNPALLVYNSLTVFQVGILGERRNIKGDTASQKSTGGNLNYLVMAFPVKINKWTTSIGLMPYTNVNYGLQYPKTVPDQSGAPADTATVIETGTGGLTQVYWSNGVRLTNEISVGLKSSYLFGPISNVQSSLQAGLPYIGNIEQKMNVNGFSFGLGASYSKDSLGRKKDRRFSAGGVYTFAANLKAKHKEQVYLTTLANDTILRSKVSESSGHVHLPATLTVGVSYGRDLHWYVGTEFSYQNWTNYSSLIEQRQELTQSWRASLGGEITPDPSALESYLKRITYRLGASYERYPYISPNKKEVKDIGINFGFSLPAGRSSLDFGGRIGKRGNKADNILEETYFKIFFGITFNDQWFIKRKFD